MGRRTPAVGEPLAQTAVGEAGAGIAVIGAEDQFAGDVAFGLERGIDRRLEGIVQPEGDCGRSGCLCGNRYG